MNFKKVNLLALAAVIGTALAGIFATVGACVYGPFWITLQSNPWGYHIDILYWTYAQMLLASMVIYWGAFLISILALFTNKKASSSWVFSIVLILDVIGFILSMLHNMTDSALALYVIGFVASIVGNVIWFGLTNKQHKIGKQLNDSEQIKNNPTSRSSNYTSAFVLMIIATCIMGWALITLAWLIPMIVATKRAADEVDTSNERKHTTLGVCTILFVNGILGIVAGILTLVASANFNPLNNASNDKYEKSGEEKDLKRKIRIAKLKKQLKDLEDEK